MNNNTKYDIVQFASKTKEQLDPKLKEKGLRWFEIILQLCQAKRRTQTQT